MGNFDKKRAFGIGGGLAVLASIIAVAANISEIIQLVKPEKTESSVAVIETVKEEPEEIIVEEENVAEVIEETAIEQEEVIEESVIVPEEVVEPETEPPTEFQPIAVYLDSLKIIEAKNFDVKNSAEDTIGNNYAGHIISIGTNDSLRDTYGTYYLGGQYKKLSGTIAVDDSIREDSEEELSILCDDNVAYTTGSIIGRKNIPFEISVNVENCQWLKIQKVQYNHGGVLILYNWKLE
ncbi:MAG: NPCBM/NEW2 domain-containing protein [Ruminococcus sp.]|nr:NPCBM/NEW2 domain-containing protein [Ruminococcus sp.]